MNRALLIQILELVSTIPIYNKDPVDFKFFYAQIREVYFYYLRSKTTLTT